MIKRILVALDPDEDTPVATRYALRLARRFDASVTGLAVVDISNIHSVIGVGGYGTEVYGRQIWTEMAVETRKVADRLLESFKGAVEKAGVRHRDVIKRGASVELIIEEMKYHDVLIVGRDSRFFYNQPDKDTDTLAKVVKGGVSPTLVVPDEYHDVEKVLIAFDGSGPASKSLKGFVHLLPYGKDIEIKLVNIADGDSIDEMDKASVILKQAEDYLKEHHFNYVTKIVLEAGKPGERIMEYQEKSQPDMIIMGAHSVSAMKRAAFGSTTHYMITQTTLPLFLSP